MLEDLSREELLAAVERAAEELLADAGVGTPPVDAVAVAERHLGLTLRVEDRPRRRPPRPDGGEIVLPPGLAPEQTQWAVARALGAMQKPELLDRLGVPAEEQKGLMGASLADLFAARLLLPAAWFAADARRLDFDVLELHALYATAGTDAIAWRLLDLPEPCVITVVDHDAVTRRRSNAWRVNRELSPAEKECLRLVSRHSRPQVVRSRGWTVQGWPIRRAAGPRQILRGVLDEDGLSGGGAAG